MSVMIVTSLGDIVIDLHTNRCPLTAKNFLKLCKIKYFNGCLFHTVQKDFTAQTGDPTGKGTGGDSVYKFLYGDQARFFSDEIHPDLTHSKIGTVAMASAGENLNASQFYFTLRDDLDYLDGKHTVFGEVAEGIDTLTRINEAYVDEKGRPYKNIRIKHTYILDDPFEDPPQLAELIPVRSPEGKPPDEIIDVRLEDDWVPMDETLGPAELEEALRAKEAESNAVFLETVGDIPDAEIKPPENVLFVCKLNPVTQVNRPYECQVRDVLDTSPNHLHTMLRILLHYIMDEDLDTIFSRFGTVLSAEVIRDYKTGDSLCYAFIEFEDKEACERAYFKMDNALIDDRRIHVDFSQSVAKLWSQYRRGKGTGKGGGCFKCGALDHIARDCPEGSKMNKQNPKYILKDDNTQRGGNGHQSYEMVFEDDTLPSMDHETHNVKKLKREHNQSSDDIGRRDHRRRDYGDDGERYDKRKRDHERSHRRDYEHNERRCSGERQKGGEIPERDGTHHQRQDKQGQRKRSNSDYGVPSRIEDQGRRKDDSASIRAKSGLEDDRSGDRDVDQRSRHKRRDIDIGGDHSNRMKRMDIIGDGEHQRSQHRERSPKGVAHHKRNGDRNTETDSSRRERDGNRKRETDSSYRERYGDRHRAADYYSKADQKHEKERRV